VKERIIEANPRWWTTLFFHDFNHRTIKQN
jgi:hypothetical protein